MTSGGPFPPKSGFPPKGETQLLVLQPTSFCNINCDYCYLPDRAVKSRMSHATLRTVLDNLAHDDVFAGSLEILWHAGEPTTLGIDYYERASEIIEACIPSGISVRQALQTNGTLITEDWCRFLKAHGFHLGLSIDGPQVHHDRHRRTRSGHGTFDRIMQSVRMLRDNGVDFYVISVLSRAALENPEELLEFAEENAIGLLCFNIEETEGTNVSATLNDDRTAPLARTFFDRLVANAEKNGERTPWVREIYQMLWSMRASASGPVNMDVNVPFRIVTVDTEGGWSTFCPELMAMKSVRFSDFKLGDLSAGPISRHPHLSAFHDLYAEIKSGLARCRTTCEYFPVCGGGCPSNKFAEHGAFDVTETRHCRVMIKALADATLDRLHRSMASAEPATQ
jgi:uncharacterized protein